MRPNRAKMSDKVLEELMFSVTNGISKCIIITSSACFLCYILAWYWPLSRAITASLTSLRKCACIGKQESLIMRRQLHFI